MRYGAEKAHEKIHAAVSAAEQDNASLEAAHKLERVGEQALRKGFHKSIKMARDRPQKARGAGGKLHPGKAPANRSPLNGILKTPTAQLGSTVDFGPKQPGLLSRGYHKGIDTGKRGLRFGSEKVSMQLHGKIDQYGGDNSSVKAVHEAEQLLERPTKYVLKKGTNLAVQPVQKVSNKARSIVRHKYLVYKQRFLAKHQSVAQARGAVMKAMGHAIIQTGGTMGLSGAELGGVSISFTLPKGWHTKKARVGIAVADAYNAGILKVEAKAVQNGNWTDVTDTLYLDISENCTVYVQVTDMTGIVTAKSVYVECFDREKPTLRASRSGRLLRVEANDDLSGVAAIFVDDVEYTDLLDSTLEVRINSRDNADEKIWIQAKDYAGNLSATYSMTNPYYVDAEERTTSSASSPECEKEKNTGNSTTNTQPDGSGTTTSAPASTAASTSVTPAPAGASATTTDPTASGSAAASEGKSEGGNKGIPSGVIAVGETQFIAIETRDGEIFYLIIDGERESDNVYLVTEATTQDLQSFTRDAANPDNPGDAASDGNSQSSGTASVDGTPAPDADTDTLIDGGALPGKDNTPGEDGLLDMDADNNSSGDGEESNSGEASSDTSVSDVAGKKGNPIPGWIVIIILLFIAAFAGYMFLVVLPRKKAKEAYLEDEDEADEAYMEEPYDVEPGEPSGELPADNFADDREDDIFNVNDEESEEFV